MVLKGYDSTDGCDGKVDLLVFLEQEASFAVVLRTWHSFEITQFTIALHNKSVFEYSQLFFNYVMSLKMLFKYLKVAIFYTQKKSVKFLSVFILPLRYEQDLVFSLQCQTPALSRV